MPHSGHPKGAGRRGPEPVDPPGVCIVLICLRAVGEELVSDLRALPPTSLYGVTKAACEVLLSAYASQSDFGLTSLRYFTVYGPRQRSDVAFTRWIKNALSDEPLPVYGDRKAFRDFTYVDDVVEATLPAADSRAQGNSIYNVAGGNPVSVNQVLQLLGRKLEVRYTERQG